MSKKEHPFDEPGQQWSWKITLTIVCAVIVFNGYRISRAAVNEITDAAAPDPLQKNIRELSSSVPGGVRIEKCRTRKSGLGLFVEIHVEGDGDLTMRHGHEIAHSVSDHLKASSLSVQHVVVHVEPALDAPARAETFTAETSIGGRQHSTLL